jgi:hypothetical protein
VKFDKLKKMTLETPCEIEIKARGKKAKPKSITDYSKSMQTSFKTLEEGLKHDPKPG